MVNIPTFKAPDPSSFTGNLSGINSNLPAPSSVGLNSPINASLGANLPQIPSMGGLSSGLPNGEALKNAVPNFSAPSIPSDVLPDAKTKIAESLPKFDSKIDLPEIQTGKLGLLSSPVDLSTFKEKSMSRLSSIVPEFSPGTKISALNALADKKSALLDTLKSAAGGALSGAVGGVAGALASGQSLKDAAGSIAKSAIGGAVGGVVGNLASNAGVGGQIAGAIGGAAGTLAAGGNLKQAAGSLVGGVAGSLAGNLAGKVGIPGNVAGAVGSAAGALAAGGNLKQAVGGAAGNLVASTVVGKLGGGVVGAAVGTVAGAKIAGASTKSSLVGGLTAGAGAFALSKITPNPAAVKSAPTDSAIPTRSQEKVEIPKNVNIVTSANSELSAPPSVPVSKSIPPASPTATIDSETGKVTLSNTAPANTTTIKETVIKGGGKIISADRYNPETNKYEPVPDKIIPPTKTETVTVVNNKTGEVISSTQSSEEITREEAQKRTSQARVNPPSPAEYKTPPPNKVKRPINPLFTLQTDSYGNEYLLISPESISIIPVGLEIVSISGTKDVLTIVYADGSKTESYTAQYSIEKYGFGNSSGDSVAIDTLPNGKTSTYLVLAMSEDYSLPSEGDSPYFTKNSDGSISYTFSDGSTATELPSGTKSLFTVKGVSADVDMPTKVTPSSLEMPADQLERSKSARKKLWLEKNYGSMKQDSNGNYIKEKSVFKTDENGNRLFYERQDGQRVIVKNAKSPRGTMNIPVMYEVPDGIISQEQVNSEFEKEWNEKFKNEATQSFAKKLAEKYEQLNRDDQVKTAESVDKGHVIEVVRTGYSVKGDSYKVKSVRLYKKTEQVN